MPLTQDEFEAACKLTCKHCAADVPIRWREDSKEHVHDMVVDRGSSRTYSHAFCLASGLRKFYEAQNNG